MVKFLSEHGILHELQPVVETELVRHAEAADEWHPHDFVPWSEGRNFQYLADLGKTKKFEHLQLAGHDWELTQSKLGEVARIAMYVNLLTEDNLPSYHREIATLFGRDSAWGEWVGQWTAEEAKHAMAMRDFLVVTRAIDPVELERARMGHMKAGYDSGDKSVVDAINYVTFQELATRIAHRNTGKECANDGDLLAENLMIRVAKDENLHMVFYRNLGKAALDIAPNFAMQSILKEVKGFSMPGDTIPHFYEHAVKIANAGIYDLQLHVDQVVAPTLKYWNVFDREDLSGEGEAAREELGKTLSYLKKAADKYVARREEEKTSVQD